jgi:hypothetical protein
LIAPFFLEEIEAVVKASDGSKSPGPDEFNFAFIKEFWSLMKNEVRIMFLAMVYWSGGERSVSIV